jgi:hypothetical protein
VISAPFLSVVTTYQSILELGQVLTSGLPTIRQPIDNLGLGVRLANRPFQINCNDRKSARIESR